MIGQHIGAASRIDEAEHDRITDLLQRLLDLEQRVIQLEGESRQNRQGLRHMQMRRDTEVYYAS